MAKIGILAVCLFLLLTACPTAHFTTFEEAVLEHRYYLLHEYNDPDWTIEDVVVVSTEDTGYTCNVQFCYSYVTQLYHLGNPAGVHVERYDTLILIDEDESGWKYADWL